MTPLAGAERKNNKGPMLLVIIIGLVLALVGGSCWLAYRRGQSAIAESLGPEMKLQSIGLSREMGREMRQPEWLPHWKIVFAGHNSNIQTAHVALVSGVCIAPKKEPKKESPHLRDAGKTLPPVGSRSLAKPEHVRRLEE